MILESIYKYRDMIFTFVEMLFLTYLLKGTGHDIKVRDYKKRILQILSIAVLYFFVIISSYYQLNMVLKILGQVILITIISVIIYRYKILTGFAYVIIYIMSMLFGEIISMFIFQFIGVDGIVSTQQHNTFSIFMLVVSKIFILFFIISFKAIFERNFTEWKDGWLICISNFSYLMVFMGLEYTMVRQNEVLGENYNSIMVISFLSLVPVLALNNLLWKYFVKIKKQEKREALKQDELRLKSEYYYAKAKSDEEVREIYHDLRNHLLMIKREEFEDRFVLKLEEKIKEHQCFLCTGNEYLDILLKDKMEIALSKEIKVHVDVDFRETEFIEPLDISSIFGNMFDNAIEACNKLSDSEEKFIDLHVLRKNSMYIIKMENTTPKYGNNKKTFNTTKTNKHSHGFGLRSIQKSLEKYAGTVRLKCDDNVFLIIAAIPNNERVVN